MRKFHEATVVDKQSETADSIVLTLSVPAELTEEFRYEQGQHLPVRVELNGKSIRRTYSICAGVQEQCLKLGIRIQQDGIFSNYVANQLAEGDTLEIMPPYGRFNTRLSPEQEKTYLAFVAGSGITPLLSIVKSTLEEEPRSTFIVFYGNRKRSTTMFVEDLYALKNIYKDRLSLHFVMSQEATDIDVYSGRIDGAKARSLHEAFVADERADEIFICGPNPMIDDVSAALEDLGYDASSIHSERFRAGLKGEQVPRPKSTATPRQGAEITVIMDGHRQSFHMGRDDASILDAAAENGMELPYSCKGGVCSTCRCKLTSGDVDMALNYALETWEIEQGYILTCQSTPKSESIELDYDQA